MNNKNLKKGLSLVLALAMICSIFVTIVIPTQAESYIYNWGTREVDCTQLSSYAIAFYSGSNTFEEMSKLGGGSSQTNAHTSALYKALQTLMKSKHTHETGYQETRSLYQYTDCQNGGGKISSFYSGKDIGPGWDSGSTWNREHTWPNSKGLEGNDENDLMMLRPTSVNENSDRGNTAYGESSGYYHPNSESNEKYDLRGDVARICLYVYTRWGNTSKMWGSGGVMENLEVLLKWMEADPVDTWEMGRNDSVQSITGTRNVFVDYPEYAWLLFGIDVPADYVSPSNNKGTNANPDSGNSGGTQGGGTGGQGTTVTIPESAKLQCGTTYVTTNATSHTNSSGATKAQLAMTSDKSSAATWDIIKNSDGSYSFKSAGKYLSADGTHVKLVNAQDANTKFEFEQTNGGVFIKCQSATYENKAQYLEVYSNNLTVYGMQADTAKYTFTCADSVVDGGGNGNDGKDEPTESETETVIETETETETETESLVQDTTASISFGNRDQRTEFSAEKQVWTQNGITFINEKAESAKNVANYANPIRLYEGSTVKAKVEGNKMITKVVIKAAFGDEEYKGAIGDSLRAAGYEYTRDGDDFIVVVNAGSLSFALCAEARITAIDVSYNDTVVEEETETEIETSTETETEINTESETETVVETESETETEQVDVEPTETETDEKTAETEPETSTSQVGGEDKDDGTVKVEVGCTSAIGTGSIVIISISLAGVMLSRKKKEE